MASRVERTEPPLIVIVGPTASGKTALAVELAERFDGEIICADSRTVYKGMDIGTAKPDKEQRARVPHWGLDLVEPGQSFTAADFKRYADAKITEIRARGKTPFLVGGTGLYIDGVIFNFQFGAKAEETTRQRLAAMNIEDLQKYCRNNNVMLPENTLNKRHLIRAIERGGQPLRRKTTPIDHTVIVGIATKSEVLKRRINRRSEQIFTQSLVGEASMLGEKYGWESEAMTGNVYRLLRTYLEIGGDLGEVKKKFATFDWALAKRQLTWFRRNPYIVWLGKDEVIDYLKDTLATRR